MHTEILVVDDDPRIIATLSRQLSEFGYVPESAPDGATARRLVTEREFSLVLLDLALPDTDGLSLLQTWAEQELTAPVVMISGKATIPDAVKALQRGAVDFLVKPIDMQVLESVIRRTLASHQLQLENSRLRRLAVTERAEFLGQAESVKALLRDAEKTADGDHPVMLEGETGTGKQVLARLIHNRSPRRDQPFVSVNCAAITETLFESELFGHEKGAFTGASSRKPGKLELVGSGTLFLDEIGELPLLCQAKLLTAVEDRRFERVGGLRSLAFSGRIIAATNRDLDAELRAGRFRKDLYYRLSTFHLKLPPLRSRPEDVPIYVDYALEQCRRKYKRDLRAPDESIGKRLAQYSWPGNVRELLHHVERIALLTEKPDISASLWLSFPTNKAMHDAADSDDLREAMDDFKRQHISRVVAACAGNQTEAAKRLGIERTHLNRLLAQYEGRR